MICKTASAAKLVKTFLLEDGVGAGLRRRDANWAQVNHQNGNGLDENLRGVRRAA
jgi:hypothetical protein